MYTYETEFTLPKHKSSNNFNILCTYLAREACPELCELDVILKIQGFGLSELFAHHITLF